MDLDEFDYFEALDRVSMVHSHFYHALDHHQVMDHEILCLKYEEIDNKLGELYSEISQFLEKSRGNS